MIKRIIPILLLAVTFSGCKLTGVTYSFSGVSLQNGEKTFSVDYFSNKTAFAPNLGADFTEALKAYLRSRTSLTELTDNDGDIRYPTGRDCRQEPPNDLDTGEVHEHERRIGQIRLRHHLLAL
mgnify:CR=1 FL=1